MFQSLSSVYNAQILVATHSPIVLSAARPEQILCFQKTAAGRRARAGFHRHHQRRRASGTKRVAARRELGQPFRGRGARMNRLPHDLIVLAADKNMEAALRGILLHRPRSLGVRPLDVKFLRHPGQDSGCPRTAHAFLRSYVASHAFAIVVFDREGCGPSSCRASNWKSRSSRNWPKTAGRTAAPSLPSTPNWRHGCGAILRTLTTNWAGREDSRPYGRGSENRNLLGEADVKPPRPKEAVEVALHEAKRERSSSIYEDLAKTVSLDRCTDPAFAKLRDKLVEWFPAEPPA